jgi:hypothetical protein
MHNHKESPILFTTKHAINSSVSLLENMSTSSSGNSSEEAMTFNYDDTDGVGENELKANTLSLIIVLHTFIILFGIVANSVVIYLVLTNKRLRNVRNAFMLNLTFSNLLLITICSPSFILSIVFKNWVMGTFWCKFIHSMQIVIILVSAFSIMFIAIDRWMFVVFARSRQFNKRDCTLIIIAIWLIAIALSAPTFVHRTIQKLYDDSILGKLKDIVDFPAYSPASHANSTSEEEMGDEQHFANNSASKSSPGITFSVESVIHQFSEKNLMYCVENWPVIGHKRIYILILFFLEFVLPCLSMLVTYIWIIRFLKVQDDRMNHYDMLRKRLLQKEKRHQKNCKLLTSLCLTFIVCCLPLSLFNIKAEFDMAAFVASTDERDVYSPLIVLTIMEELNTLLSPLLYGLMNQNFRNEINDKVKEFRRKYSRTRSSSRSGKLISSKAQIQLDMKFCASSNVNSKKDPVHVFIK